KERAALEDERPVARVLVFLDEVRSNNVGRHQVGRELNSGEGKIEYFAECANQHCFAESRHAFEKNVAAGKQADENALDNIVAADDDLLDFGEDFLEVLAKRGCELLDICHGGRSFVGVG